MVFQKPPPGKWSTSPNGLAVGKVRLNAPWDRTTPSLSGCQREYNAVMKFNEDELKLIEAALDHYDAYLISQKRESDEVQALLRRVRRGGKS
jgi:hypothetical protein